MHNSDSGEHFCEDFDFLTSRRPLWFGNYLKLVLFYLDFVLSLKEGQKIKKEKNLSNVVYNLIIILAKKQLI